MTLRTPLYDFHVAAGARIVEFAGWDMPLHYGSQIDEHNAVRTNAGVFDVSHMAVTDIAGRDALPFLRRLLANDPDKLVDVGRAIYGVLLNDSAGIVDDLIVYRRANGYRAVTNAGTRERVLAHFNDVASAFAVDLVERRDLSILAIQGPHAIEKFERIASLTDIHAMAAFTCVERNDCAQGSVCLETPSGSVCGKVCNPDTDTACASSACGYYVNFNGVAICVP